MPWNKGKRKETDSRVKKISETMKRKKIDNFSAWRNKKIAEGVIKKQYPHFQKSESLAELIGVVLGDGHICQFPRTESLRIVGNSNNPGFSDRYARIVEKIFDKAPTVQKRRDSNAINITLYQKDISKRLGILSGARLHKSMPVPKWILEDPKYIVAYLRGLYEADGSYSEHKKTYTYKFIFNNSNISLLDNVFHLLVKQGFHPHRSKFKIQVSKKEEVQKLRNLLQFRVY